MSTDVYCPGWISNDHCSIHGDDGDCPVDKWIASASTYVSPPRTDAVPAWLDPKNVKRLNAESDRRNAADR